MNQRRIYQLMTELGKELESYNPPGNVKFKAAIAGLRAAIKSLRVFF